MTEADVEALKNAATVAVIKAQKTLSIAEERLREVKQEISRVANEIQPISVEKLAGMAFASYAWWNPDVIQGLAGDVLRSQTELRDARERAQKLGAELPD